MKKARRRQTGKWLITTVKVLLIDWVSLQFQLWRFFHNCTSFLMSDSNIETDVKQTELIFTSFFIFFLLFAFYFNNLGAKETKVYVLSILLVLVCFFKIKYYKRKSGSWSSINWSTFPLQLNKTFKGLVLFLLNLLFINLSGKPKVCDLDLGGPCPHLLWLT